MKICALSAQSSLANQNNYLKERNPAFMVKKIKSFSPDKATKFLKKMEGQVHEGLVSLCKEIRATPYKLKDNSVLVIADSDGYGVLYTNQQDLEDVINDAKNFSEEENTKEMFPIDKSFIANIDSLIRKLANELSIEMTSLDYSLASLKLVDKQIRSIDKRKLLTVFPNLYQMVIAYAYKTLSVLLEGKIVLVPYEQIKNVHLIKVIGKDGNEYFPLPEIYDELKENIDECSIHDVIATELFRYGFMK